MTNKEKYNIFCQSEKDMPIFSKPYWLDALCGVENWDVILLEEQGEIIASMPYYFKLEWGFSIIKMPILTQKLGPFIKYPMNQSYSKKLSFEKKILTKIIIELPKFHSFNQNFNYSQKNWLPFFWKKFKQTTRYTYVIDDLTNLNEIYSNFDRSKKKNIKKAEKIIKIRYDLSANEFYENHKMTLKKQGILISYSMDTFVKMYNCCYSNNSGRTIYAVDTEGTIHGALFVIWDENSAYNLISTIDPETRNSGAASLLVKEIIGFVSTVTKKFDFTGSMDENIEQSIRKFGGVQTQYYKVYKYNNIFFKIFELLKEVIK